MTGYTDDHAASGVDAPMPAIETWVNPYRGREYTIEVRCPGFTSVCPKTGLPDFATLTVSYAPDRVCLELKSFKLYFLNYRTLGIFQENAANKIRDDVVFAARPIRARLEGRFKARGGITTRVEAEYPS